jgi:hypothetical protein
VSDNYIIEIRPESSGRTVQAGIVIRDAGGFRFFAASEAFFSLEQRIFKNPQAAAATALRQIESLPAHRPQFQPFRIDDARRGSDSGDFGLTGG